MSMALPLPHPGPWLAPDVVARLGSGRAPARLVAAGDLVRISHAAYYAADAWQELTDEDRHKALLVAHHAFHARRGTVSFVYSHLSAARLHGLELWQPDSLIHISAGRSQARGRHREDVVVHGTALRADETTVAGDLPATSLERTMVDSARMLRPGQAQILVDHGLRLGADRALLQSLVASASGSRGILTARRALDLGSDLSESAGESLLNYLLATMGLPPPTQQIKVVTPFGLHRIDTGWPEIKRGIEFDGKKKYFDYAPTEEVVFRERQREKALMEEGWLFLRLVWADLFRPDELERRVTRLLASGMPVAAAR